MRNPRSARLLRAGTSGALARMSILIAGVAVSPILVRAMGNDKYGAYATITGFAALLSFSDLGIANGVVTRLATLHASGDRVEAKNVISSALAVLLGVSGALALTGIAAGMLLDWDAILNTRLPGQEVGLAVAVYVAFFALAVPAGLGDKILLAQQRGNVAAAWLAGSVMSSLVCSAAAALLHAPLPVQVGAVAAPPVFVGLAQFGLLIRGQPHLAPSRQSVTLRHSLAAIKIGWLFLVLAAASAIAYHTDLIVVSHIEGAATAAVLAVSLRLFGIVSNISANFLSQLWPAGVEAILSGEPEWIPATLATALKYTVLITIPATIVLAVSARPVIGVIFGESLTPPWVLVIALGAWTVQQCLNYPFAMLLNTANMVRFQVVIASLMATANIFLSITLTKVVGVSGPIWASLLTHTCIAMIPSIIVVIKHFGSPLERRRATH